MGGIDPPGTTGGEDKYLRDLNSAFKILGHTIGIGITTFVVVVISLDLILSPIFLFAQAKQNGIQLGRPFISASWWIVVLMTVATSGILYSLLNEKADRSSLGWKIGLGIAILDTILDGAGFAAWVNGGSLLKFQGNAKNLQLGILPASGSHWIIWFLYVLVVLACLFHEPFTTIILKRKNFVGGADDSDGKLIILMWVERAGKIDNKVKLFCMSFAPWAMMFMDGLLGPQASNGTGINKVASVVFYAATFGIMLGGMALWNSWNHLSERDFKLGQLSTKYKTVFIGAMAISTADSFFDLLGFNQALFGKSELLPSRAIDGGLGVLVPYLMTAAMVLTICTTFEPLNHDLFINLLRKGFSGGRASGPTHPAQEGHPGIHRPGGFPPQGGMPPGGLPDGFPPQSMPGGIPGVFPGVPPPHDAFDDHPGGFRRPPDGPHGNPNGGPPDDLYV